MCAFLASLFAALLQRGNREVVNGVRQSSCRAFPWNFASAFILQQPQNQSHNVELHDGKTDRCALVAAALIPVLPTRGRTMVKAEVRRPFQISPPGWLESTEMLGLSNW